MAIDLLIHLDVVRHDQAEPEFVWWAESDDVPGLSGAASHLPNLLEQVADALKEIRPGESFVPRFAQPEGGDESVVDASREELQRAGLGAAVMIPA